MMIDCVIWDYVSEEALVAQTREVVNYSVVQISPDV